MKKIVLLSFVILCGAHLIAGPLEEVRKLMVAPKVTPEDITKYAKGLVDCENPGTFDNILSVIRKLPTESEASMQQEKILTIANYPEAALFPPQKLDEFVLAYIIVNIPEIRAEIEKSGLCYFYTPNNN